MLSRFKHLSLSFSVKKCLKFTEILFYDFINTTFFFAFYYKIMLVRTYGILADPVTLSAATPVGSTVITIITA